MEDHNEHSQEHRIVRDRFAELVGVTRYAPGTWYCLDCHEPVLTHEEAQEELEARVL